MKRLLRASRRFMGGPAVRAEDDAAGRAGEHRRRVDPRGMRVLSRDDERAWSVLGRGDERPTRS